MAKYKNNTKQVSKKGYICKVDSSDPKAIVLCQNTDTNCLGIIGSSAPYRSQCEVITTGTTQVFVSDNVRWGDTIRLFKSSDNISAGSCRVVKASDTSYLKIGTAIKSGKGLVPVSLAIAYIGNSSLGSLGEAFETVSKNLKSYPYTLVYGVDGLSTITYNLGGGLSVVKTFNYTLSVLTSIVLSGDTPAGILLTKTLHYTGDDLTSITYS